ncbi:site-specific integrase [Vagococcus lutrae]|uniref:site-specific integrase n=1 Tax=Vagococcus lutrae TaxID=81947 RepID=UPI0028917015|nr:site-specific integrase [Vagococcus lutrae]MDT2808437.1 site-specific integrase [Vagococcus lutrae]
MSFNITNEAFNKAFGIIDEEKKKTKKWDKRKQKYVLKNQIYDRLTKMLNDGMSTSRNDDKHDSSATANNKIYSVTTYKTYKKQCYKFAEFLKENYPEIKKIQQVKTEHVNEYLKSLTNQGLSAYSISTAKSAISKVLRTSSTNFIATPPRTRKSIKRSRYEANRDKHISEELERKFSKITSSTGLRKKEMEAVRGVDLKEINGKYYVKVRQGKGGKKRLALIMGKDKEETDEIINIFKEAGELKIAPKLPSHYDNHHYRAVYAKRIYNHYARPIDEIPGGLISEGGQRYIMRNDRAGEILDRKAMLITSKYLGHNRIDVIAQSYLY